MFWHEYELKTCLASEIRIEVSFTVLKKMSVHHSIVIYCKRILKIILNLYNYHYTYIQKYILNLGMNSWHQIF